MTDEPEVESKSDFIIDEASESFVNMIEKYRVAAVAEYKARLLVGLMEYEKHSRDAQTNPGATVLTHVLKIINSSKE